MLANARRVVKLDIVDQFIMSYSGLRGAIAFALVVLLHEELVPERRMFITTAICVIYFTNLVQVPILLQLYFTVGGFCIGFSP
jgi:sodium/hydrogen exchanger-like protein 3